MKEYIEPICIQPTTGADIPEVLEMINGKKGQLLGITTEEVLEWISKGHSLVGKFRDGTIVAHQSLKIWEEDQLVEGRSAFVKPKFRNKGYGTSMKTVIDRIAMEQYPHFRKVSFTEKDSEMPPILLKSGYVPLPMAQVPEAMFNDCPPAECFKKTGIECGCNVFVKPQS